ncbi:hypothetical protein, partial [Methanomethylovorans sp.]|uniref:hypothetical protein n=1 Tax=Methanomethylovorans sp. TaxID=2758717 RepID=UPI00351BFEEE
PVPYLLFSLHPATSRSLAVAPVLLNSLYFFFMDLFPDEQVYGVVGDDLDLSLISQAFYF